MFVVTFGLKGFCEFEVKSLGPLHAKENSSDSGVGLAFNQSVSFSHRVIVFRDVVTLTQLLVLLILTVSDEEQPFVSVTVIV